MSKDKAQLKEIFNNDKTIIRQVDDHKELL